MNQILSLTLTPFTFIREKSRFKISKLFLTIYIISIIFIFIFSILQIGFYAREFYLMKNYEGKLNELSKGNEILEIDFSKYNSLSNIESFLSDKNFVKANGTKYIQIIETSVAAK